PYPPPPIQEEAPKDPVIPASQLAKEIAADKSIVNKKYRYRYIIISGKALKRFGASNGLEIRSGETNQDLRIMCPFSRRNFDDIPKTVDQTIRGLCMDLSAGGQTLALECCEPYGPAGRRDPRRVLPEFLPHAPGHNLTYDNAIYPDAGRKEVASIPRQVHF